jgi:3-oxoacyl-[acyl-carrier protein] reductase
VDLGIKDRLALVTGASRGIGQALARELAREGARVILVARSADGLEAARRQMTAPNKHLIVALDLMADGSIQKLADIIREAGDLDIMIHNLGGSLQIPPVFAPVDDWKNVWQFNVGIGQELNRIFIPAMIERRWGRIVHLSTLSTTTYQGNPAYVSSKCALESYVKSLSREVSRHNIIVTAVAPGALAVEGRYFAKLAKENPAALEKYLDDHLPIRRFGTPEDVAGVVAFLCSEQASYMAGAVVAVDGGWM